MICWQVIQVAYKKDKLPGQTISQAYKLEHGEAVVAVHEDAMQPGEKVLVGCAFVIDLPALGGRRKLEAMGMEVHALCEFDGL